MPTEQKTSQAPADSSIQHAPARPGRWIETVMQYRYAIVIILVFAWVFGQKAFAADFTQVSDCVVGQRVVNRDKQAGVIVKAEGSSCHVKLDATGKIDYNIFWMLRPETSASPSTATSKASKTGKADQAAQTASSSAVLPKGKYQCYMLTGGTLNYAFIDIHIDSASSYRDKSGKAGSYTIDANQKIIFTGSLASAHAKLLPGSRIGLNMNGGSFYNTTCSISR